MTEIIEVDEGTEFDDDEWIYWEVLWVWAATFGCWWVPILGEC